MKPSQASIRLLFITWRFKTFSEGKQVISNVMLIFVFFSLEISDIFRENSGPQPGLKVWGGKSKFLEGMINVFIMHL